MAFELRLSWKGVFAECKDKANKKEGPALQFSLREKGEKSLKQCTVVPLIPGVSHFLHTPFLTGLYGFMMPTMIAPPVL